MIHYFICRIEDSYVRFGVNGTRKDGANHLTTFADETIYLGELPLPIKADIDEFNGLGVKVIGKSVLVTCKHIGCMMTIRKPTGKSFYRHHMGVLKQIRSSQEELLSKES